jgi:hypothetical protein
LKFQLSCWLRSNKESPDLEFQKSEFLNILSKSLEILARDLLRIVA